SVGKPRLATGRCYPVARRVRESARLRADWKHKTVDRTARSHRAPCGGARRAGNGSRLLSTTTTSTRVVELPRVNLLPPEIFEKRQLQRAQAGLAVVVLVALVGVGLVYI